VQQTDAAAKVSGLEAFLTQYPNSVMKEDALEILMGAYQQVLSQAKTPSADAQSDQDAGDGAEGFASESVQPAGPGAAGLHQAGDGDGRPERAAESCRRRPERGKGFAVSADSDQAGWHVGCGFSEAEIADHGNL